MSPEAVERYWETKRAGALAASKQNPGVGRFQGSYEEGLLVGLKEVLANCLKSVKGKAGLCLGSGVQPGRRTADLFRGC